MKKILEAILAINLAVLSCIVFIGDDANLLI